MRDANATAATQQASSPSSSRRPAGRRRARVTALQCPYCARLFTGGPSKNISTAYSRHLLTHTKRRPYQCEFCLAKFTTSTNRRRHILRLHPEMADRLTRPPAAAAAGEEATNVIESDNEGTEENALGFTCRFCSLGFACKGKRTLHERHCPERPNPPRVVLSHPSLTPATPTPTLATTTTTEATAAAGAGGASTSFAPPNSDSADTFFVCPNCEQEVAGRQHLKRHLRCFCPFRDDVFATYSDDDDDDRGVDDGGNTVWVGSRSQTKRSRRILSKRRAGLTERFSGRLSDDTKDMPASSPASAAVAAEALWAATRPHTRGPTTVICPYDDCMSAFSSRTRWLAHVARRHPHELARDTAGPSA